ncbi:MAG: type II secretion system protein GspH [Methylococcales bacterium]|nr:MAG: type II secretion system protein GspH [Methylococcales bacterium]
MRRLTLNNGFTLLELLVVLFIMILGFSVVGINLSSGNSTTAIRVASRDMVSALRYTRGQALILHQETTMTIDLAENTYTVSDRPKSYVIPKNISLTVVTAQSELSGNGIGNIRFFPDGSSTGGRITLEQDKLAAEININWLTGQIKLGDIDAKQ